MTVRRRPEWIDEETKQVRPPQFCPICKGALEIVVIRYEYRNSYRNEPPKTRSMEKRVCKTCGIAVRVGKWPLPPGHTTNGWTRLP